MRIAAYIRVSTDVQAEKGNSLFEQKQRLAAYCVAMGWKEPEFYIDDGYSAKDINRPRLQELITKITEKKYAKVMVTKLDRISRRLLDLLTLIDMFQQYDVSFVSVSESFDTETPSGRLALQVLGAVAEFERERISERVKDNMLSLAMNTDKVLTKPCFGFDIIEGRYQINESEAKYIQMMFDLAEQGHGHRMIAKLLNEAGSTTKQGKPWDQTNVKRLMNNEAIAGILVYNKRQNKNGKIIMRDKSEWVIKENNHPAIIDPNRFEEVQGIFKSRSRARKHADSETYLLTGLVRCKYCGGTMKGSTSRMKREYGGYTYYRYICSSYVSGYGCKYHAVHRDQLEQQVIERVKFVANNSLSETSLVVSASRSTVEELNELKTQLNNVNKRMQKQIEAYENDLISADDLKAARARIDAERNQIKAQIEKLESKNGNVNDVQNAAVKLLDDITGVDRIKSKMALRKLIDQVIVEGDVFTVVWRV